MDLQKKFHDNMPKLKIACILDEFSYDCFKYECNLRYLPLNSWRKEIQHFKPEILFVESAWRGLDRSWSKQLLNLNERGDYEIYKLLEYCKTNKITTIFWNKEDPPHYDEFINAAKKFDFVFTTDQDSLPRYRRDLKHGNVYVLPFAAQPMLHNPINTSFDKKKNVAFAGSWYQTRFMKRQIELAYLLEGSIGFGLDIYARDKNNGEFPPKYAKYIVGQLQYEEMSKAYKLYKIYLNADSVKKSPTMFSRRVFEILASGTHVISSYSSGVYNFFNNLVPIVFSEKEVRKILSKLLTRREFSERLSLAGVRKVHSQHTYRHRLNYILKTIGFENKIVNDKGVTVIAFSNQRKGLKNIIKCYKQQTYKNSELLIFTERKISTKSNDRIKFLSSKNIKPEQLYDILHPYVAIFDENNYYAPNYLLDLMNAVNYTNADIVGKGSYYKYCKKCKTFCIHNPGVENVFSKSVNLYASVLRKDILNQAKTVWMDSFSLDEQLLSEMDIRIYSSDRFNFVSVHKGENCCDKGQKNPILSRINNFKAYVTVGDKFINNRFIRFKINKLNKTIQKKIFSPGYTGVREIIQKDIKPYSKILIYGAGEHTKRLLEKISDLNLNIIGLIDSDQRKQEEVFYGYKVYSPLEINSLKPDVVIISSLAYEKEIYYELKRKINPTIDIYPLYHKNERYSHEVFTELYICKFPANIEFIKNNDF